MLTVTAAAVSSWALLQVLWQRYLGGSASFTYPTTVSLVFLALGLVLAIPARHRSGLTFGRQPDSWLATAAVVGLPVLCVAIIYPILPERPFAGASRDMWLLSPVAQDLWFLGVPPESTLDDVARLRSVPIVICLRRLRARGAVPPVDRHHHLCDVVAHGSELHCLEHFVASGAQSNCEIGAPSEEAPRPGPIPTIYAIAAAGFVPDPSTVACLRGSPCLNHPAMIDLSRIGGPASAVPVSHSHVLGARHAG